MNITAVIRAQYGAALEMLRLAIVQCPDELWDDPHDKNPFWHVAYHALFYAHFYLQKTEADFTPWAKHLSGYNFLGPTPWPPHEPPKIERAYTRAEMLEYLLLCLAQADEILPQLDLSAASGFSWLPFNKLELQFYSIRHIQQHAGQLMERLSVRAGIEVDWVGTRPAPASSRE